MYNPSSNKAGEFISHEEIMETLAYAEANKNNEELIDKIIGKAKLKKGLNHREASVLLACEIPEKTAEIYELARQIKEDFYGNRIVMFAPLYLSNYCVNGCVYCPYHLKNKHIARKKLTQEEIRREVIALQDMGHKRLALETGEDPVNNPIEYVLEGIKTIYGIKHKNGEIRRVNVNIAATTVENYRKLKDAGIGTYILFQETYHKESYEKLHPTGPKHDYCYHTEAMDRAMEGGIDDVGIGVLFGLELYRYEFAGLLMHAEHLEAVHGVGPHTISVPRIKKADNRTLDQVVHWLMDQGFIPSFCTACYREGRTGDRFMSLCKSGQIQNCCHPNALMTLKEYLEDYAAPDTREIGGKLIMKEIQNIPREKVREIVLKNLEEIEQGKRDFRF